MLKGRAVDTNYLFRACEVILLIGSEVFYRENLSIVVSGLPDIGKASGGERVFYFAGCYQGEFEWHAERTW